MDSQAKEIDALPKSISSEAESGALPPVNGHHAVDNEGDGEARPLLSNRERKFSTLEPTEGIQDLESASIGGSARQR